MRIHKCNIDDDDDEDVDDDDVDVDNNEDKCMYEPCAFV